MRYRGVTGLVAAVVAICALFLVAGVSAAEASCRSYSTGRVTCTTYGSGDSYSYNSWNPRTGYSSTGSNFGDGTGWNYSSSSGYRWYDHNVSSSWYGGYDWDYYNPYVGSYPNW